VDGQRPAPAGRRIVENPLNLLDEFALVAPGHADPPATVSILTANWRPSPKQEHPAAEWDRNGHRVAAAKPARPRWDAVVLALGTLGLLFVGLMAVAGFTVMAQRRQRALGMLASLGGHRQARFVW